MAADGVCKVGAALAPRSAGKPIRVSQSNIPWEQPCPPSTLKSATVREVLNDDSNLFDVCVKFKPTRVCDVTSRKSFRLTTIRREVANESQLPSRMTRPGFRANISVTAHSS